jgi:hypothetical protein
MPERLRGDADASAVERGHGDLEALALLAQKVFLRDLHVVEDQLAGGAGANAQLVVMRRRRSKPFQPFSTMNAEMPRVPMSGVVTANTT